MKILKKVKIDGNKHRVTGATKHFVSGVEITKIPTSLKIASFEGDPGFYLLYFGEDENEVTDTYHDTIEEAMDQAEREFLIAPSEWEDIELRGG